MSGESPDLELWLPALERWFVETGNPLFAWEAIDRCFAAKPPAPIPVWCLPVIASAARNLRSLAWGRDFRDDAPLPAAKSTALVGEALGLTRQGQKNAFQRYAEAGQIMRAAHAVSLGMGEDEAIKAALNRTLSPSRRAKAIRRGKKLICQG